AAYLNNKEPANTAAIAGRQKSEWQRLEEKPKSERANHDDGGREPAVIKKPAERSTVESERRLKESAVQALHPMLFVSRAALGQKSRAHQRGQRQRNQA